MFCCSKLCTSLIIIYSLISILIPSLKMLSTSSFIDTTLSILRGEGIIRDVILPIMSLFLITIFEYGASSLLDFAIVKLRLNIRGKLRPELIELCSDLDYSCIENEKTLDLISRVKTNPEEWVYKVFNDLISLTVLVMKVGLILGILAYNVWWAVLIIIAILIPFSKLSITSGRVNYEANRQVTKQQRKYLYFGKVLSSRDYVEERVLFQYGNRINEMWLDNYEIARKYQLKVEKKWFIRMKSSGFMTAGFCIIILFLLLAPTLNGVISIGLYVSFIGIIFELIDLLSWDLTNKIDAMTQSKEAVKDLNSFLELERIEGANIKSITPLKFESLEFRNVKFKYPNGSCNVLQDVTFTMKAGKHYAFVGENGSGKTTIIKLILGLYSGYEGEILLNGKSLKDYKLADINATFSNVFQDFAKYSMSIRDNIEIGDINAVEAMTDEKLNQIVDDINLKEQIEKLDKGLDTQLGKINENGLDLSGGQWQKIAIARTMVSSSPVRILDEPTSALDPISESEVYQNFQRISKEYTTIFVTHRLASVKEADEIFVLEGGTIIERGSHKELIDKGEKYCKMYETQKGWYV